MGNEKYTSYKGRFFPTLHVLQGDSMLDSQNGDARRFIRITSGSFRDDGFAMQHDYGRSVILWKDFEILLVLTFEKKGTSSPYLLFYANDNPVLYYIDGGTANYRVLLKHEYTGRTDIDFAALISKFQFYLEESCIDTTVKDFMKGGGAFLPSFKAISKVAEYAESVRTRSHKAPRDQDEDKGKDSEDFLKSGSRKWEIGEVVDGTLDVQKCLQGGMGIVYIVNDIKENMLYAMKTFQDQFLWNRKIIKMFIREAEVWVKLGKHKNIVQAEFVKNIDGKPYIFLEYIDGTDLGTLLKKGSLDIVVVIDFCIQFCSGMIYANEKLGIVHRDVKPSNCMLTQDGLLKITDFGLVQIFHERTEKEIKGTAGHIRGDLKITQTGAFKGTMPYMAPERFQDSEAEIQGDIYSFGVMIYEMLTGKRPIDGQSIDEWMTRHLREIPPTPMTLNPYIPPDLSHITMKCLEKDPSQRYQDFRELRNALLAAFERITGVAYHLEEQEEERSIEEWLSEGNSLEALGQYKEALFSYDHALKLDPEAPAGWHGKARTLSFLGKIDEAIECYERALALSPRDATVWYDKGNLHFQIGDGKEALRCYQTAIEIDPNLAEVWNKKGLLLDIHKKPDEALQCYDEALRINPRLADCWNNKGNLLYKRRRYTEAEKCYDEALTINPRNAHSWYNKANIIALTGGLEDALNYYQKALDVEPGYTQAWIGKGLSHIRLNQMKEARESFESALKNEPSNAELWNLNGQVHSHQEAYEDALACYDRALKIDPKNMKALYGMTCMLMKLHAYERALMCISKALSIEPENRVNREFQDDIRKSIEHKKKYLEMMKYRPDSVKDSPLDIEFTSIFIPMEQKKEGTFWNRFLKKGPQALAEGEELYRKAVVHFERNEFHDALTLLEHYLSGNQDSIKGWLLSARTFEKLGQSDKVAECLLKSLPVKADSPLYWTKRGELLERSGRALDANRCFDYSMKLDPKNIRAAMDFLALTEEQGFRNSFSIQALDMLEGYREEFQKNAGQTLFYKIFAMLSMGLGVHSEAMRLLEGGLKVKPGEIELSLLKGMCLGAQGKVQEEMKIYNELFKTGPQHSEVLLQRGLVLEKDFRVQEAQRLFDMVIQKKPDHERAWYYKGSLLLRLNDYEESLRCINKILELNPRSVRGWILKGIHMKKNQKYEDALWAFNKATELNAENADAWKNRGILLLSLNRFREAFSCFEKITEIDPENNDGWILKSISQQDLEEFEASLESCGRALVINPRSPEALVALSSTLMMLGREKDALFWVNKALRVDNRCMSAWLNKGVLNMRGESRDEALQAFDKALEIRPEYAKGWYDKGVFLAMRNQLEESLKCFDRALLLNGKFYLAWLNRGNVLLMLNKPDEAMKCFDKASELNTRDARVLAQKGITLMLFENHQEALKIFNRAQRLDSNLVEILVNKGLTLVRLGRGDEAQPCFEEARQISADFARRIRDGQFSPESAASPMLPTILYGPFVHDNPEYFIYEKPENTIRRDFLNEIFEDEETDY
jgi:tetratricopeptide (TPR) repeat protein